MPWDNEVTNLHTNHEAGYNADTVKKYTSFERENQAQMIANKARQPKENAYPQLRKTRPKPSNENQKYRQPKMKHWIRCGYSNAINLPVIHLLVEVIE